MRSPADCVYLLSPWRNTVIPSFCLFSHDQPPLLTMDYVKIAHCSIIDLTGSHAVREPELLLVSQAIGVVLGKAREEVRILVGR